MLVEVKIIIGVRGVDRTGIKTCVDSIRASIEEVSKNRPVDCTLEVIRRDKHVQMSQTVIDTIEGC